MFFLLKPCTLKQKRELQKVQNNAFRTCLMYLHRDHVTIKRFHSEMNLVGLKQRRNVQLLKLMYLTSKNENYIKKPVRALRGKLMSKCTGKYMNSPMYRGSTLWDTLPVAIQRSLSI